MPIEVNAVSLDGKKEIHHTILEPGEIEAFSNYITGEREALVVVAYPDDSGASIYQISNAELGSGISIRRDLIDDAHEIASIAEGEKYEHLMRDDIGTEGILVARHIGRIAAILKQSSPN